VPGALHSDLCGGDVELPEIIRGELDGNRSDVLFKALQFRGAGNRNDPGFLCKEPGERDLSGCRILLIVITPLLQNPAEPDGNGILLQNSSLPIPKIRNAGRAALSRYCRFFA